MPRVIILPGGPGTTGRHQNVKRRIHGSAFFIVCRGRSAALQRQLRPRQPIESKTGLGLFRRRAPLAAQGLPTFVHQHQRQRQQQHGDDQLQGRHGPARPGQQGTALGHDAQH